MKSGDEKKALPKWLYVQRIALYYYIVVAVFLVIHALGFLTGEYIFYAYGNASLIEFYHDMQWANRELLGKALAIIIFGVLMGALELRNHAAGVITLLISLALTGVSIVFSVVSLNDILLIRGEYLALDLSHLDRYRDMGTIRYVASTFIFDWGIVLWAACMAASAVLGGIVFFNAHKVREDGEGSVHEKA